MATLKPMASKGINAALCAVIHNFGIFIGIGSAHEITNESLAVKEIDCLAGCLLWSGADEVAVDFDFKRCVVILVICNSRGG